MMPDPEPLETAGPLTGEGAVVKADSRRVKNAHFFEAKRRMPGIGLEEGEVLVGERPDVVWKLAIVKPEIRIGEVVQSGVQRPAS